MTRTYETMTDDELSELTDQVLREHVSGEAPFHPRGDAARRTVGTVPISLRVPRALLEGIKTAAADRNLPYQRLIKQWLEDALVRNAPDDTPRPVTLRLTAEQVARLHETGSLDIHLQAV